MKMIEALRAEGDISSVNGMLDFLQRNIAEADSGGGGGGGAAAAGEAGVRNIENLLDTMPPQQLAQIGRLAQDGINAARALRRTSRGKKNNAAEMGASSQAYMPRTTRARAAATTGALVGKFIEKNFEGGMYRGEVVRFDANCGRGGSYHIKYEDGDEEDLSADEVLAYIVVGIKKSKAKAKAKKKMAPPATGKRKAAVSVAAAAGATDAITDAPEPLATKKRVRSDIQPPSLLEHPRSAGTVKAGWKLRKNFLGHGPSSNCFRIKSCAVCSPSFFSSF